MEKDILLELKNTIISQEEKKKELISNAEEFYKILWSYLMDEVNKDTYGLKEGYSITISYKAEKDIITDMILYNVEEDELNKLGRHYFNKNLLSRKFFELINNDEIEMNLDFAGDSYYQGTAIIRRKRILDLLKTEGDLIDNPFHIRMQVPSSDLLKEPDFVKIK